MVFEKLLLFCLSILIATALSLPIGFFLSLKLFPHRQKGWEFLFVSFGMGFTLISILWYIGTIIGFTPVFLVSMAFFLSFLSMFLLIKKKSEWRTIFCITWQEDKLPLLILGFLFLYYAIQPLSLEYGFTRDYDVAARGLQQTGKFVLPGYFIETYYPPLVSIVSVHYAVLLDFVPEANLNKIMISIFTLITFLLFPFAYCIGFFAYNSRQAGLCFMIMLILVTATRNAIIGGSTYPALLANFFFLFCILCIIEYKEFANRKMIPCIALGIAGIFLSHLDIFFVFLWFIFAVLITISLFSKEKKKLFFVIFCCGLISFLVILPYFLYGYGNKAKFDAIWTEEKWLSKAQGESHPKPIKEIAQMVGFSSLILTLLTLLYCIFVLFKDPYGFFLLLWALIMVVQNSWAMLFLSKNFIHIYPLNIIMWMGLLPLLLLTGGFGLFRVYTFLEKRGKAFPFILFIVFLAVVSIVDYETFNIQKTYRPGAGYLWSALSEKNVIITSGDSAVLEFVKKNLNGTFLVPDTYAGYYFTVATGKNATLIFYEGESYHDPSHELMMNTIINQTESFFKNPITTDASTFLEEYNISYIYLPSSQGNAKVLSSLYEKMYYNASLFEEYKIIARAGGAKILQVEKGRTHHLLHLEAEDYVSETTVKEYYYPKSIFRRTVILEQEEKVVFLFPEEICFSNATVYLHSLTTPITIPIEISLGNLTLAVKERSVKIKFSEIENIISYPMCIQNITLQRRAGNLLVNKIPLEVNWLELEYYNESP